MSHRRALAYAWSLLWLLLVSVAPRLAAQSNPNAITGLEITPDGGGPVQILQGNNSTLEFNGHAQARLDPILWSERSLNRGKLEVARNLLSRLSP